MTVFFIGIILITIIYSQYQKQQFSSQVKELRKDAFFDPYFKAANVDFHYNKIMIKVELTNQFEQIPLDQQFLRFSQFHHVLRYRLKNGPNKNSLYKKDIQLEGSIHNKHYRFIVNTKHKEIIYSDGGVFLVNDKIYTEKDISRKYISEKYKQYAHDRTSNGILEYDVLIYFDQIFSSITKNLHDVYPGDYESALEATSQEFRLSKKEIEGIIIKWFFYVEL